MIRIISRDAVFSRMLCILFLREGPVAVSARADDLPKNGVCLWDEDSMGMPEADLPGSFIVITSKENLSLAHGIPCILRPFKLDEFKNYVLEYMRAEGNFDEKLCFDDESASVSFEGATVKFSPAEYLLLRKLYDADGEIVSKEDAVSVFDSEESNVLEVYVYYLRKKLKKLPCKPEIITVRGKGYVLKKGDLN